MPYETVKFPEAFTTRYHNPTLALKLEAALKETIEIAMAALELPTTGSLQVAKIKVRLATIDKDLLTRPAAPEAVEPFTHCDVAAVPGVYDRPW